MTREEIAKRVTEAIASEARIFMIRPPVKETDRLGADLGIDSVGLLYLVMALEDAFGLEIDDAEDLAERFATWGQLLDYLDNVVA